MWSKRAKHVPFVQQLRSDAVAGQSCWIGSVRMLPLHGPIGKNRRKEKNKKRHYSNKNINILHMKIVPSVNCSFENWPKKKWNLLLRYQFQFIMTPIQPVGWKRSILQVTSCILAVKPRYNDYIVIK